MYHYQAIPNMIHYSYILTFIKPGWIYNNKFFQIYSSHDNLLLLYCPRTKAFVKRHVSLKARLQKLVASSMGNKILLPPTPKQYNITFIFFLFFLIIFHYKHTHHSYCLDKMQTNEPNQQRTTEQNITEINISSFLHFHNSTERKKFSEEALEAFCPLNNCFLMSNVVLLFLLFFFLPCLSSSSFFLENGQETVSNSLCSKQFYLH